jgi:hypothetical protein
MSDGVGDPFLFLGFAPTNVQDMTIFVELFYLKKCFE